MASTDLAKRALLRSCDNSSKLCAQCQGIDFDRFTCEGCAHKPEDWHFHTDLASHVSSESFCPGCRLILSAVGASQSSSGSIDKQTITISRRLLLAHQQRSCGQFEEIEPTTGVGGPDLAKLAVCLGVFIDVTLTQNPSQRRTKATGTIIRSDCSKLGDKLQPEGKFSDLEDSTEHFLIRGRSVLPTVDLSLIKYWIHSCESQHTKCNLFGYHITEDYKSHLIEEQTIRLIDVEELRVILATQRQRYVALSYVWGSNTAPMLRRDTVLRYSSQNSLQDSMIGRTIHDAIQLVRDIGERYLWVDTLCIVQDDDNDKLAQLAIMDRIFYCASLVIVAASGDNVHAGLAGIESKRHPYQRSETVNGIPFITVKHSIRKALANSVWNSRGWTFGEAMLARRLLVFTEEQVYWNCKTDIWREDLWCESPTTCLLADETNSLHSQVPEDTICRTRKYCDYASQFSGRRFSQERDVIWAFISILRMLNSQFPQGFIWGLPYERLDTTLLWHEIGALYDEACHNVHKRDSRHRRIKEENRFHLPYPSWSWLSTTAKIRFIDRCGDLIVSEVSWHEPLQTEANYPGPTPSNGLSGRKVDRQFDISIAMSASERRIMEYGFLQFTAHVAELCIRREVNTDGQQAANSDIQLPRWPKARWVSASIHIPSGENIAMILVDSNYFDSNGERSGEFVLLSSNADATSNEPCHRDYIPERENKRIVHQRPCKHIRSHNIMLIDWIGNVAYRRGLAKVEKGLWGKVHTRTKRIILG
ncbi:uncharacterized protein Z519_01711 [Cladophialophora bantiana CBS 173.52]|uniref:Heterokaryon incompatibility domain-containing protein n=1 Tax=Cladophialophora bantiana (strain ATCC 10958 / CBS 173.52 / CDC B-1940 / NIH 8579) TaxID=1442370 RepID=A0A0D2GID7_CLAB1|nr:uncharacterized protein Z519_01711 [Cladophialophora bantiana CBS 173.52]KIW98127.1 hypothetical protein Z519_01711 [Cladophialophora bantiana CBS 173.52]